VKTAIDMALAPKSDQLNADDLIAGPVTVTITGVRQGTTAEQPVAIHIANGLKPYYPCKSMRRVIVALWGQDATAYTGRRLTLYRDPAVAFGGMAVGGIRISHASHLKTAMTLALTVTRAKRAPFIVKPLPDARDSADTAARAREALATATALQSEWQAYEDGGEQPDDWRARLAELGTELRELRGVADVEQALSIGKRLADAAKADAAPTGGAS
jgi:hypothetical protein